MPILGEQWYIDENGVTKQLRLWLITFLTSEVRTAELTRISFKTVKDAELQGYTTESGWRYLLNVDGKNIMNEESLIALLEADAMYIARELSKHVRKRRPRQLEAVTGRAMNATRSSG